MEIFKLPYYEPILRSIIDWFGQTYDCSVPAGIFLRALRPARTVLRPARLYSALPELFLNKIKYIFIFLYLQNVIAVFVFSDSRCKHACNCLQICAHVFINRRQNCAQTSSHSRAGFRIVTEFWSFTRKTVLHLVIRALNCARFCAVCSIRLCPNFGRSRDTRLRPISFAPRPFPNPARTLDWS